jgi:hypothetical protein
MDGSPSSIIMLGLGNGTFAGSPGLVLTLGLGSGEAVVTITDPTLFAVLPENRGHLVIPDQH